MPSKTQTYKPKCSLMNTINFWKNWSFSSQLLFFLSSAVLSLTLVIYAYLFSLGDRATIAWQHVGDLEIIPTVIDTFSRHFFDFNIYTDAYLLVETFAAASIQAHPLTHYLYFAVQLFGLVLLLTVISDLKGIGYFAAATFLVFFLATANLELLRVFPNVYISWLGNKLFFLVVVLAYIPLSYIFYSISYKVAPLWRFVLYSIITGFLLWIAARYGRGDLPIQHLTHYNLASPIILTIAFCAVNGYEIVRVFVHITTSFNHSASRGTVRHLLILSLIYLFNLVYVYLQLTKAVDWGIFYVHPFVVYIATIVVGLWGWHKRALHFRDYFDINPTGSLLYVALAILSVSSISFAFATHNTPLMEVYEDSILYTHFAFGLVFLAYVFSNYGRLLSEDKRVYKILYTHEKTGFLFSWSMGILLIFLPLLRSGFIIYDQAFAGYYNSLGYLHQLLDKPYEAEQYYRVALAYDPLNFHTNYTLGMMAKEAEENAAAFIFFQDANIKKKHPQPYIQMAQMHGKNNKLFKALFTLGEGVQNCPESGELYNNLAMLFAETNVSDSVSYYLQQASQYSFYPEVVEANRFLLGTKYNLYKQVQEVHPSTQEDYIGVCANKMAFLNKQNQAPSHPFNRELLADSILSTPELCYLYNYALNPQAIQPDSIASLLTYYEHFGANYAFDKYLKVARAHILFEQGNRLEAFKIMQYLYGQSSLTDPYYANLLGLRLLQIGAYKKAAKYLKVAYYRGLEEAQVSMAIALSHLNNKNPALAVWKNISMQNNPKYQRLADEAIQLMHIQSTTAIENNILSADSRTKQLFLAYAGTQITDEDFDKILLSISEEKIQNYYLADRMKQYLQAQKLDKATKYFILIEEYYQLGRIDPTLDLARLQYWYAAGRVDQVFFKQLQETTFSKDAQGLKYYYLAGYYAEKQLFDKALVQYKKAVVSLPYRAQIWIDLANIYRKEKQEEKAYELLLDAYHVNPESAEIIQAYILQCIRLGYDSFAKLALQDLQLLISKTEYRAFGRVCRAERTAVEKRLERAWDNI